MNYSFNSQSEVNDCRQCRPIDTMVRIGQAMTQLSDDAHHQPRSFNTLPIRNAHYCEASQHICSSLASIYLNSPYRAMVLFFPIIAAIPTVIGISEGIAEKNRSKGGVSTDPLIEKEQMRKFTLECYCDQNSKRAKELHGGKVVLKDGKVNSLRAPGCLANSKLPI